MNFLRKLLMSLGLYYRIIPMYTRYLKLINQSSFEKNKAYFDKLKTQISDDKLVNCKNISQGILNTLPNSGGIPVDPNLLDPKTIEKTIFRTNSRISGNVEFAGLALDDALVFEDWKHYSFVKIAEVISKTAKENSKKNAFSALELGCGAGSMFNFVRYNNCEKYIGVDANTLAFHYSTIITQNKEHFRLLNLQEEINFNTKFDLVYSFEVLEHIREDKIDFFIKTIVNHMDDSSIFLGTAALSFMDVHITVKPKEWWMEKFNKAGLVQHTNYDIIKEKLEAVHPFNWKPSNTNIFVLRKG